MKAYLQHGNTAHLELTFNELTEIKMCLAAYVRGAGAVNNLAISLDARLAKMWDYWMNGPKDEATLEHRPGGVAIVGKPPASPTKQRTPAPGNRAELGLEPAPQSTNSPS